MELFTTTTEDQLRTYLLEEGKKRQRAQLNAKIEKRKARNEEKVANKQIRFYKKLWYETYVENIAEMQYQAWCDENIARKDEELKKDAKKLQSKIDEIQDKTWSDINKLLYDNLPTQIKGYNDAYRQIDPTKQTYFLEQYNTITTLAQNRFAELKDQTLQGMQKLFDDEINAWKKQQLAWTERSKAEKLLRSMGKIPLKIEDKIQEVKDTLDELLGRTIGPVLDPESADFNLDMVLVQMERLIDPLLAVSDPLKEVGGKIPILGNLTNVLAMLKSSSGGSQLTKEEVKKLIKGRPSLTADLEAKASGIYSDLLLASMSMPMILIKVIFEMLKQIVSLLGSLGVGAPFPLSLIPTCIEAVPIMLQFTWNGPLLMYAAVKGLIIDKLAEAMALTVQKPNLNIDAIVSGDILSASVIPKIQEAEAEIAAAKSKPQTKNWEYDDVIKNKLVSVESYGYSRTDLQRILDSYKKIYDGSNGTINKYTGFSGDVGKGNMIPTKEEITQIKGTPDDFKTKLDQVFSGPKVGEQVTYDKIKKTASVVGMQYYNYEDQIKTIEPNENVILEDTIKS